MSAKILWVDWRKICDAVRECDGKINRSRLNNFDIAAMVEAWLFGVPN
jgi:hypothetical protein